MKTAQEVHIYIRQGLEKMLSYQPEGLNASEIDFHFNVNQERFLDKILSQGFQDTQVDLDMIAPLIVMDKEITSFRLDSPQLNYVYGVLPANYRNQLNTYAQVLDSTNIDLCEDLGTIPLEDSLYYSLQVAFPTTTLTNAPYFNRFEFSINAVNEFSTNGTAYDTGFPSTDSKYELVDYVLNSINNQGKDYDVFWETFLGTSTLNTFTFFTQEAGYDGQAVKIDIYNEARDTIEATTTANFASTTLKVYDINQIEDLRLRWSPVRFVEQDKLNLQLNTSYYKPTKHQPIATINQGKVLIYQDKSFIVNNILMSYVRKPKKLSLSLGQACELSETAARKIADRTIEQIAVYLQRPDSQNLIQVNRINDN